MTTLAPPLPDDALQLPAPTSEPPRPGFPLLTALVPVAGALVLWALTGSPYMLWFAALGPLLAFASLVDGGVGRRRRRRTEAKALRAALRSAGADLDHRHTAERAQLCQRHPDVAGFLREPNEIWRAVPGRDGTLVVGAGVVVSGVRVTGGEVAGPARDLRVRARSLRDAPVTVPAAAGIAVVGPPTVATAIVRALTLQLCLIHPPARLSVVGETSEIAPGLPHARSSASRVLHVSLDGRACPDEADFAVVRLAPGDPVPPRCSVVLTAAAAGRVRADDGERRCDVDAEAVSSAQAVRVAALLTDRWAAFEQLHETSRSLAELVDTAPAPEGGGLAAVWGTSAGESRVIDLVADGPHALVIGMTGSGKSELLTSWIVALCARRSPSQVSFLLIDFKGGRTFDALAALPHVTGILTDLDEAAALRAVESLRAEIRRRERVLAEAGAREVSECDLGRLVVVVDEYAALVTAHPGVQDLFADVAARGRALGMHLILATQRATGAFRDALAANAPLRIALRVADPVDASTLLGGPVPSTTSDDDAVGVAWVRRACDRVPLRVRVARCDGELVERIAVASDAVRAPAPWLPELPRTIALDTVREPGKIVLGLADEPERQSQPLVTLADEEPGLFVVGRAGSGRTGVLAAVAAQASHPHWIANDPEGGWDALAALERVPAGTVVLLDDADILLDRLGGEYAVAAAERLQRCAREARRSGIRLIVSAQRLTAPLARVADLLPLRAILALPTRSDHVAAGGEAADHHADTPVGRGRIGRTLIQFAAAPAASTARPAAPLDAAPWYPGRRPVAFVTGDGTAARDALRAWRAAGVPCRALADVAASGAREPLRGVAVYGTPDAWLARWQLLAEFRSQGEVVVDAACAGEYRALTGRRELPPFAVPGRAWLLRADRDTVARVALAR